MTDKMDEDLGRIEGEVRAMLHRRAGDVQPHRPEWRSLGNPQVGVAYSPQRGLRPVQRRATWFRPATAAASVLVIVLVGAVVVDRMGGSPVDESAVAEESSDDGSDVWPARSSGAYPEVPVPGSVEFEAYLAAPLHPVTDEDDLATLPEDQLDDLVDPVEVATDYLASVDIAPGSGPIEDLEVAIAEDEPAADPADAEELTVSWSTWDDAAPAITSGHVYLRRSHELASTEPDRKLWLVVGARTQGLEVAGVQRAADTLTFGIDRTSDETGIDEMEIAVDGNGLAGNLPTGERDTFTVRVADEEVVHIRLQHLESDPLSVFEMTVPALGG